MLQTTDNRQQQLKSSQEQAFVLWFEEVGIADLPLVGGKNASLGEMIQQLTAKGETCLRVLPQRLMLIATLSSKQVYKSNCDRYSPI